jgi:hypothetical protein
MQQGRKQKRPCSDLRIPDHDLDKPPQKMRDVINHCSSRGKQLLSYDTNTTLLGSMDINPFGENLVKYLIRSNLYILN